MEEQIEPTNSNGSIEPERSFKRWLGRYKLLVAGGVLLVLLIVILLKVLGGSNPKTATTSNKGSSVSSGSSAPVPRQAKGTAVTLGTGNFTVGTDIAEGVYDITAPAGQSGNFIVSGANGTAAYNEFIGKPSYGDVSKIRVILTKGQRVQISDMSGVTFTPTTAQFVTAHATAKLYAGTFVVGQDIGAGRYVATPASGESGDLFVDDSNGKSLVNKVLGSASDGDVPSYAVTLNTGDVITLSGIDSVTFTAQ